MDQPRRRIVTLAIAVALFAGLSFPAAGAERVVAATFDDLPANPAGTLSNDVAVWRAMTAKLIGTFEARAIPVVGFVNEGKLDVANETAAERDARVAVLRMWTDAGLELGNHTYSHPSLNHTPLTEFQDDVVRGEPVTRALMEARGGRLRYFRHPFLQVGLDLEKRRAFEAFLKGRGYTVAPVTIDNDEWVYAAVYADALRRKDTDMAARVSADYLRYMLEVVEFDEGLSRALFGREIPQVLLVHANQLNADCFAALAASLAQRGYRFASLDTVLRDPAYQHEDTYVGAWGLSWLHHWQTTAGRRRTPSPDPPAWVTKAYESLSR